MSENIFILAYQSFFASTSLLCVNLPSVKQDRSPGRVCQRRGWAKIATDGGPLLYMYITFEIYSWFWLILSCLPYMFSRIFENVIAKSTSDSVFWPKTNSKVAIIKTNSATIAFFFLLSSFPSPRPCFFSFPLISIVTVIFELLGLNKHAFWRLWLQISLGWFSKNRLDV